MNVSRLYNKHALDRLMIGLFFIFIGISLLVISKSERYHIIKRYFNQLHAQDYPSENNSWIKYSKTPVFGNALTGTVFDPYVIHIQDKLVMFVSERKTGNVIKIESQDGINWTSNSATTVLRNNQIKWASIVNRACVQKVDSLWYMWFTGQYKGRSSIGLAISNDMNSFEPIGTPIICAEQAEGGSVMNPCVLYDGDMKIFHMWYAAGEDYEPDAIFYAHSKNGIKWTKLEKPVLSKYKGHKWESFKVGGCDVIKDKDGTFIMYYIGYQNIDVARICFATSKDGINWKRPEYNLIIGPSVESWDKDSTYKPSVSRFDDKLYLWYNGRNGGEEYIGLAIHP